MTVIYSSKLDPLSRITDRITPAMEEDARNHCVRCKSALWAARDAIDRVREALEAGASREAVLEVVKDYREEVER